MHACVNGMTKCIPIQHNGYPIRRILVRWKSHGKNLEILCHHTCNQLYYLSGSTDSTGSADCVTNHTSVDSESERWKTFRVHRLHRVHRLCHKPQGQTIVSWTTHLWTLKVTVRVLERISGSTDSTGSTDCVTNHTSVDPESDCQGPWKTFFQGPQTPQGPQIVSRTTHLWILKVTVRVLERLSFRVHRLHRVHRLCHEPQGPQIVSRTTGSTDCVTNHRVHRWCHRLHRVHRIPHYLRWQTLHGHPVVRDTICGPCGSWHNLWTLWFVTPSVDPVVRDTICGPCSVPSSVTPQNPCGVNAFHNDKYSLFYRALLQKRPIIFWGPAFHNAFHNDISLWNAVTPQKIIGLFCRI